jgi:hypothetical protein
MASVSSRRKDAAPALGVRRAVHVATLGCIVGCAQVLGVPTDPALVPSSPGAPSADSGREAPPAPSDDPPPSTAEPNATPQVTVPSELTDPAFDGAAADGTVPAGQIMGIDEALEPAAPALDPEAGAPDAGSEASPEGQCEGRFDRVPVDIVFIVDNSASMAAADRAFEAALPAFIARLEDEGVDQRVILLSRHRSEARSASDAASTSVCVSAPVSGLADCPSERPVPGQRFFPYSVEIGNTDSLDRALEAFDTPDPFGLTQLGWSEWLRVGARKVFIEITDDDSALPGVEFVVALAAAGPEHFNADPTRSGFVFHSILGVAQKARGLDLYGPDEPIEPAVCSDGDLAPGNSGGVYQALSRATGGHRQSICPVDALDARLLVLAVDVVLRSVVECPAGG